MDTFLCCTVHFKLEMQWQSNFSTFWTGPHAQRLQCFSLQWHCGLPSSGWHPLARGRPSYTAGSRGLHWQRKAWCSCRLRWAWCTPMRRTRGVSPWCRNFKLKRRLAGEGPGVLVLVLVASALGGLGTRGQFSRLLVASGPAHAHGHTR